LQENKNILTFDLSGKYFFSRAFHQHQKGSNIGATGATEIANILNNNRNLTILNLGGKFFFFITGFTNIKKSIVWETWGLLQLPKPWTKTKASPFLIFAVSIFSFHVLYQHQQVNNIGSNDAIAIANMLGRNKSITILNMFREYYFFSRASHQLQKRQQYRDHWGNCNGQCPKRKHKHHQP
jgi:hypothetical protein